MELLVLILTLLALLFAVSTVCVILYQVLYKSLSKDYYSLLKFLGNYKKGRFVLIYIAVFLVQLANQLFLDKTITFEGAASLLKETIESIVLKMDFGHIEAFMQSSDLYKYSVVFVYSVVLINVVLFIVSLCLPTILRFCKSCATALKKNNIIIIGYNEQSLTMLSSVNRKKYSCILLDSFTDSEKADLIAHNYYFYNIKLNKLDSISEIIYRILKKYRIKNSRIIINKGEKESLVITKEVNDLITRLKQEQKQIEINGYVLGENTNKTAYIHYVEESSGRIHFVNRHKIIAMDFIKKYPMTKFMDERHIDYSTATLNDEINLNVYMIGFGNVNKELLNASIANNQYLVKTKDGKLKTKLVNYYIYDSHSKLEDKNINHYYNRFDNEMTENDKSKYLPLDVKPAEIIFRPSVDINHAEFYKKFRADIMNAKENDISYIIVSYGSAIDNIDLTTKLTSKLNEWTPNGQFKVFCRIGNTKYIDENAYLKTITQYHPTDQPVEFELLGNTITSDTYQLNKAKEYVYYPFGQEDLLIYDVEDIFNNEVEKIAKERNFIYDLEYDKRQNKDQTIVSAADFIKMKKESEANWYKRLCQIQRDSNVYAFYNLRSKLNLLGFDYVEANEAYDQTKYQEATIADFNKVYLKDAKLEKKFEITYQDKGRTITKPVYESKLDEATVRWNMAVQEHYRWNAYHISSGVVPATIDFIITSPSNGKDFTGNRRHGNITTMDGLKQFGKIVAVKSYMKKMIKDKLNELGVDDQQLPYQVNQIMKKELSERFNFYKKQFEKLPLEEQNKYLENSDVIKYDFQILDDLEWLFEVNNFVLLKRIK